MKILFDLEASDQECAFFALYAGLRMYMDLKKSQPKEEGAFSIAGAEAYCMLQKLKKQHPKFYNESKEEYEDIYVK